MNNITTWGDVFNASLQDLWWGFVQFTPRLVLAIVFFMIGWALGSIIARALEQVFHSLKVDKMLASMGVDNMVRKTGMNLDTGYFIGQVVKWFVIIVFLLPSLNLVFGPNNDVSGFLLMVLAYLPNVIIAAFILIIASIVSQGLARAVSSSSKAMNVHAANMLGAIAKYAVWIFAFIIALGQLGVAAYYMSVLFTGIIAMIALGGALAFGLGGRDAAARFISKLQEEAK